MISTVEGVSRRQPSATGEWVTAYSTISCSSFSSTPAAPIVTRVLILIGPAGIDASSPSRPRSSDTLSAVTLSVSSVMPNCAACNAILVASQVARAARDNQPGDGAELLPPIASGMSVTTVSPFVPVARHRRPSSMTAVIGLSWFTASFGLSFK